MKDGLNRVVVVIAGRARRIRGDQILVELAERNLDGLGLEAVGVASHPQQSVEVDDRMRTTNSNIYAAGDVCSNTSSRIRLTFSLVS